MLRKLTIENFKAVGNKIEIDLKPVTLLFGPNSAGKSTIIQAIHYAHALLETGDPDVTQTSLGGGLDLGGYKTLLHGHYRKGNERLMKLGFTFEPDEETLVETFERIFAMSGNPLAWAAELEQQRTETSLGDLRSVHSGQVVEDFSAYWERMVPLATREQREGWLAQVKQLEVQLDITYSTRLERPIVRFLMLYVNGQFLAMLYGSEEGAQVTMSEINEAHPLHPLYDPELEITKVDPNEAHQYNKGLWPCLPGRMSALPWLDRDLGIEDLTLEDRPVALVGALIVAAANALRDELGTFRYVGPIRQAPERGFRPPAAAKEARWACGLGAWDAIYNDPKLRQEASNWLAFESRLDTGYQLTMEHRAAVNVEDFWKFTQGSITAEEIKTDPMSRLVLFSEKQGISLEISEVGQGLTQVIPVVAAALDQTIRQDYQRDLLVRLVVVEQPELHIHPRMQVALGDLFLSECKTKQFIIETHSEHLMLRLLRRIRETAEGTLEPDAPEATPDMVTVLYVNQDDGELEVSPLRITDEGDFQDRWPNGFFSERRKELM